MSAQRNPRGIPYTIEDPRARAKAAAARLDRYFSTLGTDEEQDTYDPADDARTVKEFVEGL